MLKSRCNSNNLSQIRYFVGIMISFNSTKLSNTIISEYTQPSESSTKECLNPVDIPIILDNPEINVGMQISSDSLNPNC